ncbi:actin [candidate division MSBL1 archaeon SCGC-AAA259D14]|uniref:Actin n=2 Tax=candidate division MSBL1 TaxID=215777 RepID=A0A133U2Z6_9EURY|nr:actin [candidate division MSBL1 archaeon SCGC-AAA259D14]
MSQEYFLGTDIGTLATKTIVVSSDGEIIGSSNEKYDVIQKNPTWAEQWPEVWEEGVYKSISKCLDKADVSADEVRGISISGLYGGSGIPVDENFEPLHSCIIWMDRRATSQVQWIMENIDIDEMFQITGNYVDTYYGFTKILWLKENKPSVWDKTHKLVPPSSYVEYKLTDNLAIDYSSAGNIGGIFDINELEWSEVMCEELGIPVEKMPEKLVRSEDVVGEITSEASRKCGLKKGTPVIAGGIDAPMATLGAGAFERGDNVAMMGTSMCWGVIHEGENFSKKLVSMPHVADPEKKVYTFGGAATAGAIVNWFKGQFGQMEEEVGKNTGIDPFKLLDMEAEDIPPGSEGLVVLPYFKGERCPIWDVNARGNVLGLTLYHTKAHLFRAFLEAVGYSLRHNIEVGGEMGLDVKDVCKIVGGISSSSLWTEILTDITGKKIVAPSGGVGAPLGNALLVGVGTDLFDDYDEIRSWIKSDEIFSPSKENQKIYDRYYEIYRKLYKDIKDDMHKLTEISEKNYHRS